MRGAALLQYVLPHRLLSRIVRWAARGRFRPWKDFLIRRVVAAYAVDLTEAAEPDIRAYASFNAFFTRALRDGARAAPTDPTAIACPADGRVSQCATIGDGRIVQAKDRDFSVAELIADERAAIAYADGAFLTVYLSPRDYHRVHMPLAGRLRETVHIPGRIFSVAPFAVAAIPRLFARNERLVCHFDGEHGPFVVVMVGAMLVSGIETVWSGVEVPPYGSAVTRRDWRQERIDLARMAEMARFNMGSTVIVLLPRSLGNFDDGLVAETAVKMGEPVGAIRDR